MRGDIFETNKILRDIDRVEVTSMFPLVGESGTKTPVFKNNESAIYTATRRTFISSLEFSSSKGCESSF